MEIYGLTLLLDLYDCQAPALKNGIELEEIFDRVLRSAGLEIVQRAAHQFPNQGITLTAILSQSHATLHTWPEVGFVTADVYACGEPTMLRAALATVREMLAQHLMAQTVTARLITRGLDSPASPDVT